VERYPERVRYLEHAVHENRGMSASRSLGIGPARGEYVAFLDAQERASSFSSKLLLPRKEPFCTSTEGDVPPTGADRLFSSLIEYQRKEHATVLERRH
jgi:hypothetical protein